MDPASDSDEFGVIPGDGSDGSEAVAVQIWGHDYGFLGDGVHASDRIEIGRDQLVEATVEFIHRRRIFHNPNDIGFKEVRYGLVFGAVNEKS